jgi:hypothetical protein
MAFQHSASNGEERPMENDTRFMPRDPGGNPVRGPIPSYEVAHKAASGTLDHRQTLPFAHFDHATSQPPGQSGPVSPLGPDKQHVRFVAKR